MQRGVDKNGWRILGPGGGGAMYIPTLKPDDPDTALIACDMTGSYLTRDGGQSWAELNFKVWVGAFAFDPTHPEQVYAGATGLYRSQDGGRLWQLVFPDPTAVTEEKTFGDHADHSFVSGDNWPGGKIEAIAVDPAESGRIFIGVKSSSLLLFYTQDGCKSWTQVAQLEGTHFIKCYLDPTSPADQRSLYLLTDAGLFEAASGSRQAERLPLPVKDPSDFSAGLDPDSGQPAFFIASPAHWEGQQFFSGLYHSLDRGRNWDMLAAGLDADLAPGQARNLNHIAASPLDARRLYLSALEPGDAGSPNDYFGIFTSQDLGQSWQWCLRIGPRQPENRTLGWIEQDYHPTWGGAPFFLSVAPSNPQVCYATDWGTAYRSLDGGATWNQLYCNFEPGGSASTRGLDVTNINTVCFDPHQIDHLVLACGDIGALHSRDGGKSWSHTLKGVPAQWVNSCYQLIFDPQVEGKAWAAWSDCHDLPRPKMFKNGHFSQAQGGVTRSEDGLASWNPSSQGLPSRGCAPTDLLLDPHSPLNQRTLYAALLGKGVYKSSDDGQSWSAKNKGLSGNLNAWKLVRLPDGTLFLLVCRGWVEGKVIDGALYNSTDAAEHWQPVPLPSGVNFPNDLCFDPDEPARMYLAAWPTPSDQGVEQYGGLWVTEAGGKTWRNIFDPASHVYGVVVDKDNPATLFLTNFEGAVQRSDDRGGHWQPLAGYNFKWAKQPILDPYNPGMLYLTTFGSSIWYGSARGASSESEF